MRIVQLGPFPPPHGGVQTNLVAIRDYVREQGHSCAVINITRHRKDESDEVYYPKSAPALLWELFRKRYDIVHLHIGGRIPLRVAALAAAATSVPWAKSILTLHSGGFPSSEEGRRLHTRSLLAYVFRRFNAIIGVNQEMMEMFWRLGVPKERTRLILPHSVARNKIAASLPEPLASFFHRYQNVLVAICGLEPEYDIPRQIEALGSVLNTFPDAGLAILGSGSQEAAIRRQIAEAPYRDHILGCGDVPHDVTLRALIESKAMLRTTLYDGDAISVREALYLGTPVIATNNGMRPDGVKLIPIANREALSAAIEDVLANQSARTFAAPRDDENLAQVLDLYAQARSGISRPQELRLSS